MARFVVFKDFDGDPVLVNTERIERVWQCPNTLDYEKCFITLVGTKETITVLGDFESVRRTITNDHAIRKL